MPASPDDLPVDLDALERWLTARGVAGSDLSDVELLAGGTQNILVRFRRGAGRFVLRRPPQNKRARSDETIRREVRVLRALSSSRVPHPRLVAAEPDPAVLGAAFYVMTEIPGFNATVEVPRDLENSPSFGRQVAFAMVEALAALAAIEVTDDLAQLGSGCGWLERQPARWLGQYNTYLTNPAYSDRLEVEPITRWLTERTPSSELTRLIHGDYHFANVMIAPDRPALAAVVDWELATIGHPLIDLAHLLITWPGRTASALPVALSGLPERGELVGHYARVSGVDVSALPWFEILACLRLAVLVEGTNVRAASGSAEIVVGDRLHEMAVDLIALAFTLMERYAA